MGEEATSIGTDRAAGMHASERQGSAVGGWGVPDLMLYWLFARGHLGEQRGFRLESEVDSESGILVPYRNRALVG